MSFAQRVGRGLLWNQLSRVVELGSAYAASVLIARALGAVPFGTYSVAYSLVTLSYYATSLGLNEILNTHVPRLAEAPGRVAHLLKRLLRQRALVAGGVAAALVLGAPLVARAWRDPALEAPLRIAGLYAFFYQVSLLLEYFLVGALQVPRVSRVRILVQVLNLGAAAGALRFGWDARVLFAVMTCTSALGVTWLLWGVRAPLRTASEPFDLAPLRRFGLALWVTNFVNFFLGRQADVLVIGLYRPGTDEAGCYSVASMLAAMLASVLLMGAEGVSLAAFSDLERRVDRGGLGTLWRLHLKLDMLLSIPLLGFGLRFAGDIVHTLYDRGYDHAVPLLIAYCAAWVVVRPLGGGTNMTVLYAMNEPRVALVIYGASGAFNLVANLALVHAFGAPGAVVGTTLAMVGSGLASATLVMRRTGARLPLAFALQVALASAAAVLAAGLVPRPGGFAGLALAALVGLPVGVLALRLLRPFDAEDRRLLQRLSPRLGPVLRWL